MTTNYVIVNRLTGGIYDVTSTPARFYPTAASARKRIEYAIYKWTVLEVDFGANSGKAMPDEFRISEKVFKAGIDARIADLLKMIKRRKNSPTVGLEEWCKSLCLEAEATIVELKALRGSYKNLLYR